MLSVILVNYNTYDMTRACIRSIKRICSEQVEIIVVDNASTEKDISLLVTEFNDLVLIKNSTNLGFAKANNQGIDKATGEYIVLINSDTELVNDAISLCKKVLEEKRSVGVVTGQLLYPDQRVQHNCQSFPSLTNELLEITRLHKLMPKKKVARRFLGAFFDHKESILADWVWGTFFMFRKKDLARLREGRLSDDFFMYGEDMEWCYQFKEAGLSCYYNVEARLIHHMGASGFGSDNEKSRTIIRNELLFVKKYHGNAFLFTFRFLKMVKYKLLSFKDSAYKNIAHVYQNTQV